MGAPSPYQVLGVEPTATPEEVKRAYRAQARRLHPDVNREPDATKRFAALQKAYETLSDPERRRRFDRRNARRVPASERSPSTPHFGWSNIAAPRNGRRARPSESGAPENDAGDPTGFEELYRAFFEPRRRAAGGR